MFRREYLETLTNLVLMLIPNTGHAARFYDYRTFTKVVPVDPPDRTRAGRSSKAHLAYRLDAGEIVHMLMASVVVTRMEVCSLQYS